MKRILCALAAAFFVLPLCAQNEQQTPVQEVSGQQQEWLGSFRSVSIDGPMKVVFKAVDSDKGPRITYDCKGAASGFKYRVDRNGCLIVSEKADPKRTTVTEVTIDYHSIETLTVARAEVLFDGPIRASLLDVVLSSDARAALKLDVKDLDLRMSGRSSATLTGRARYLTVEAANARLVATDTDCVAADVKASNTAVVELNASDRLVADARSATIRYKAAPHILRIRTPQITFGAGKVEPME